MRSTRVIQRFTFTICILIGALLRPNYAMANTYSDVPQTAEIAIEEKTVSKRRHFRVGVSYINSYPLFSFVDKGDKGFAWSVLTAFAEQNNIEFEYVHMPITRLQPSMDSGAIDFIFPDNPSWGTYRSNRFPNIYSGPIISTISSTFVTASHSNLVSKDIKKVAIPFGYTAYTWFEPVRLYNIQTLPVRDLKAALNSVRLGTVDAADVEYNIGQYLIEQHSTLLGLEVNKNLPHASVDYHLSTIKHILLLEDLTEFVDKNQNLVQSLKQKYNIKYHDEVFNTTE